MRIISGKYKGHQLTSFKADHIRPTTDRVKETLFNKWMFQLEVPQVLDLFCGTGNLGLEALSRGAGHVTFVELNPQSIRITEQNIQKLKVPKTDYTILRKDVIDFLRKYQGDAFDLIFVDPPFTEKMAHEVMEALSHSPVFGAGTLLAIESQRKERIDDRYPGLERYDACEFGDKTLSFFRKSVDKIQE
jgi:16S rRNA (guanine966-N2)-methyltransferase